MEEENNPPKQTSRKAYREWIVWPESVCFAVFFFCLARIFVYLRFPGGNCGLSVVLCACQTARENEGVSMWVCGYATCWAAELCPELSAAQKDDSETRKETFINFLSLFRTIFLIVWLSLATSSVWMLSTKDVLLRDPSGLWAFFFLFKRNTLVFIFCVSLPFLYLSTCGISCFYVLLWFRLCVEMNVLRWHRLSVLWKSWMFSQEPTEEQVQITEPPEQEKEGRALKNHDSDLQSLVEFKTQDLDDKNQKSNTGDQNSGFTSKSSVPHIQKSEPLKRSCSEPCSHVSEDQYSSCPHSPKGCRCGARRSVYSEEGVDCVLQVDNSSEGDDGFLQREGSQRRSRRRFRRVNPRGERELVTDGQEPSNYNTVGEAPSLAHTS